MIKGFCHTTIEEAQKYSWPKVFASVPNVGDWIRANSEDGPQVDRTIKPDNRKFSVLQVISICHSSIYLFDKYGRREWVPQIEIELGEYHD